MDVVGQDKVVGHVVVVVVGMDGVNVVDVNHIDDMVVVIVVVVVDEDRDKGIVNTGKDQMGGDKGDKKKKKKKESEDVGNG